MKKLFILLLCIYPLLGNAQYFPVTVAEGSNFQSTSTYADVMNYIKMLEKASKHIKTETIATSIEGRDIPLMVVANPMPKTPRDIGNRIVIYIQANIHAGEVEGKEASLMFVRDLLKNPNNPLFKNIVLLVCPILNADGNESISPKNRPWQNGPVNGVGVRHNGQMLDLNRDAMKLETPEMVGVVTNVLNRWDPSIVMDCHTTNGSYHQEPVTFTWMMNPNGNRELINYMRDRMMPWVSTQLSVKYKTLNCFYGEFIDQKDYEKGWISYASEPRYFTNYIGLRNRLSILNENYVYAPFDERVYGCYNLIASVCDYAMQNSKEIKDLLAKADREAIQFPKTTPAPEFAITYEGRPTPQWVTILTYEAEAYTDEQGRERFRKTDRKRTVTVPYIADYYPTSTIPLPFAYIVRNDKVVTNLLKNHGIQFQTLTDTVTLNVEQFTIDSLKPAPRINQGHYNSNIFGKYVKANRLFTTNYVMVKTSQPLGQLAAYLLEPQSDDGLVYWNFWDRYLVPQWGNNYNPVPVFRITDEKEFGRVKR
ncbi:MAG TPA: M14 family metallopeptidase [Tenuifilum sp.]|nr:M14 family metallopeptidase [Tenuifilum sp.]